MYSDDEDFYYLREHIYDTDDSDPFDYGDDYYDDYYDSDDGYAEIRIAAAKFQKEKQQNTENSKKSAETEAASKATHNHEVVKLVDQCCKLLALNFPFAYLQDRFPPVPDEVQLKVISYSFPDNEDKIQKYAEFSRSDADMKYPERLCNLGKVTNMMQIGFRLSATVEGMHEHNKKPIYVTIHFDRGKITSAHCSCDSSTSWCVHVIAVALTRIRKPEKLEITQLRLPISDSLNLLSREQLLKFSQYLLCQHQNDNVVETAQSLLDKLLNHHGDHNQAQINTVDGAPDPTAGPGIDDDCHWFVCSKGFKARCEKILYEPVENLGFVPIESQEDCNNHLLHELWIKNRRQQAVIRDEIIELELDSDYYGYSSSRHQELLQILETVFELLEEDSTSAVVALTSCTEQILSRMEKQRSPYCSHSSRHKDKQVNEAVFPTGSIAMGFTARPFSCWTLCDELSRLWQMAVLSPRLQSLQRQQIAVELKKWDEQVHASCREEKWKPWKGLEVAYNLAQAVDWSQGELWFLLKGNLSSDFSINGCTLVYLDVPESNMNTCTSSKRDNTAFSFYLPFCFSLGSLCLDINSWCSIIEALQLYKYHNAAINLAFALSLALVTLYKNHIERKCDIFKVPITVECVLRGKQVSNGNSSSNVDTPMDVESEQVGKDHATSAMQHPSIWPPDTLLSVMSFAFLYDVLSKKMDLVDNTIVSHRQLFGVFSDNNVGLTLKNIPNANSLKFQIGLMGLFLPRFPAATMQQEVEQFDTENWLTHELLLCDPSEADLELLSNLAGFVLKYDSSWPLAPPSSLVRVILYHTLKAHPLSPNAKSLTCSQKLAIEAAIHTLGFLCPEGVEVFPWALFEFSQCRLWSKLGELAICCLADSPFLERAMDQILRYSSLLGAGAHREKLKEDDSVPCAREQFHKNTLEGRSRVSYGLAKAVSLRTNKHNQAVTVRVHGQRWVHKAKQKEDGIKTAKLNLFPKDGSTTAISALRKCAIRLGAHSLLLEKFSDRSYTHGAAVSWLIEYAIKCGVEGIKCLIQCHGNINKFLKHDEAINLCSSILMSWNIESNIMVELEPKSWERELLVEKEDDSMLSLAKDILLSMLHEAISSKAVDRVKEILSTCRENRNIQTRSLVPWIAYQIRTMTTDVQIPFEVLLHASEETFACYKQKLLSAELKNRQKVHMEGGLGLKRLFDDAEEEQENEEPLLKPSELPNPFMTHDPHPYLDLAFTLGIMGLDVFPEAEDDDKLHRYHGRVRDRKERLRQLCDLICYIAQKKWLHEFVFQGGIDAYKCGAMPVESDSDSAACAVGSSRTMSEGYEAQYLMKYVTALVNAVRNPMWLFQYLSEISTSLCRGTLRRRSPSRIRDDNEQSQIMEAVSLYPSLHLLLDKTKDAFSKLLLGPKVRDLVERTCARRPSSSPEELRPEFVYGDLGEDTLKDTLKTTKAVFNVTDPTGANFKKLAAEVGAQYAVLKPVMEGAVSGEEVPRPRAEREFHIPFSFWPFIAHDLALYRRNPLEDLFD